MSVQTIFVHQWKFYKSHHSNHRLYALFQHLMIWSRREMVLKRVMMGWVIDTKIMTILHISSRTLPNNRRTHAMHGLEIEHFMTCEWCETVPFEDCITSHLGFVLMMVSRTWDLHIPYDTCFIFTDTQFTHANNAFTSPCKSYVSELLFLNRILQIISFYRQEIF